MQCDSFRVFKSIPWVGPLTLGSDSRVVCGAECKMLGTDLGPAILPEGRGAGPFLMERWWVLAWPDTVPGRELHYSVVLLFLLRGPASNYTHMRKLQE